MLAHVQYSVVSPDWATWTYTTTFQQFLDNCVFVHGVAPLMELHGDGCWYDRRDGHLVLAPAEDVE